MNKQTSIQILQAYATGLNAQSYQHKVQSKIFANQGLTKMAEKYADHSTEEAGWVDQFIARILDLGGTPQIEAVPAQKVYEDVVEFLKADLEVSVREVPNLGKATMAVAEDFTTYDILKGYYKDEEEDMYWMEGELALIEKIGLQNWLNKQL